jgi:DNA recombination protein RmuC
MNPIFWAVLAALAVAVACVFTWTLSRRSEAHSDAQWTAVRQEMQNSLSTQSQSVAAQMNNLVQLVSQQLGQVRQELHASVSNTSQVATDTRREISQQLQSSTEALMQMTQKIGEVQQTSQSLSTAAQTLQSVLGGAKTRGTLGEVTLERLLGDALPQSAYDTQYRFASTGAIVDAIVRSGERVLSIDSKFPLEAYRRLVECGDEARRDFSLAVRKHADSIAEKYILPGEHTFEYALMFVPSEGVYYELLMTQDTKYGRLDEYCRGKRVFPVSPNTFYACLNAIAVSLKGQTIEENARQILASLAGLQKQLDTFADVYEKLGTHIRNSQRSYEDADSRLTRARNSLEQMAQGALPSSAPAPVQKSFEPSTN